MRREAYEAELNAYKKIDLPMSYCLNSIKMEARTLSEARGYEDVLGMTLADSRMETLCRRFHVTDERDFRYMFMKSVFSCLTTLFSPKCTLTATQKRAEIRRAVENEQVQARSRDVFGGMAVQALCAVIRTKNVPLNYAAFHAVARAGTIAPALFTKLKHRK